MNAIQVKSHYSFGIKATQKTEKVKSLIKAGFEYVCQKDNLIFSRKRK
jgi:hypothetical protein